jgi:hypothetical protein
MVDFSRFNLSDLKLNLKLENIPFGDPENKTFQLLKVI